MSENIGVGIIGLGFMGRTHLGAYRKANDAGFANRLVAVCDADPARRSGEATTGGNLDTGTDDERLFDPSQVAGYARPEEILADERVHLVSICTHTDTHVDLGIQALEAGKHVLVEKPIAIDPSDVRRLADAARAASTLCMPAMCMRFWPGWSWLKGAIADGSLGAVCSAAFQRLGTRPDWAAFYADLEQSGGAVVDLHIHDTDFVEYCFGTPDSIACTGSLDHVTTLYRYSNGPAHVMAEGGWDHTAGFPFRMRYVVVFEQATADFDLSRDPPLCLSRHGESTPVDLGELAGLDGYDGEVRFLLNAIRSGSTDLLATMDEAVKLAELLEQERRQVS